MQNRFNKINLSFLFLSVAVLLTMLMTTPSLAKQNDVLPSDAMAAVAQAISKDLPASYDIEKVAEGYASENRAHGLKMEFSDQEIRFCKSDNAWSYAFTLTGIGYDTLKTPLPAEVNARGNRIELQRGCGLTEWYLNTPFGIEQGFTLHNPPADRDKNSLLRLELTLQGPLDAVLQDDRTVVFKNSSGTTVTRYAGLYVTDADNKSLPAHLEIDNGKILLLADDSDARYPVTVDPLIQQAAKLIANDAAAFDSFGISVAIGGDTVVVGVPGHDNDDGTMGSGSVYVFVKTGSEITQTAKLTASDADHNDGLGGSVAVSGDTVIVGADTEDDGTWIPGIGYIPSADSFQDSGSAYVFVKPAGGWSGTLNESAKLTASDPGYLNQFGGSVAISGDTAIVGADNDNDFGAAYVFVKPAGGWSGALNENVKLTASDAEKFKWFGDSVAISGDTAIVGAGDGFKSGSAYVFVKPAGGWSGALNETAKLTASDADNFYAFGQSVAVSGDTVIVGAANDSVSAYVFVKPAGGWNNMTQTAKLTASDASIGDFFGRAVAISGDTAIVGANYNDYNGKDNAGVAYVFANRPLDGAT